MQEVTTNAKTGEVTVRDYSADEIATAQAIEAAATAARNAALSLTFAQLQIGLVTEGWITEAEGEAWLEGRLPAPVSQLIASLPQGQRFAAKARAVRPSVVMRSDPLVALLGVAQGKTSADLDAFFTTYSGA